MTLLLVETLLVSFLVPFEEKKVLNVAVLHL